MTFKDVGVCLLGWVVILIISILMTYTITYFVKRKRKQEQNSVKVKPVSYISGILYFAECVVLGFLCLYGGSDAKLYSTGEKPTKKEVGICIMGWGIIALIISSIVLICF